MILTGNDARMSLVIELRRILETLRALRATVLECLISRLTLDGLREILHVHSQEMNMRIPFLGILIFTIREGTLEHIALLKSLRVVNLNMQI